MLRKRILVSLFHDVRWGRDFVRGLAEVGRKGTPPWLLQLRSPVESLDGIWSLGKWDGAILQIIDSTGEAAARSAPCPIILLDPRPALLPRLPRFVFDHKLAGVMAAEHLLETGRSHHAFVGFSGAKISEMREEAYLSRMRKAGKKPPVLRVPVSLLRPRSRLAPESLPVINRFISGLPRPLAVFSGNDELARALVEICLEAGYRVPEDVAILGADDDDLLCQTCTPDISSVHLPYDRAGREAGRFLLKLMDRGRGAEGEAVSASPTHVETRESTRVVPGEDRMVETAVRLIHQDFASDLKMEALAARAGVSLSTLERRFRTALGRTPLEELRRFRIRQAMALLEQTDLSASEVSKLCGFSTPIRFSIVFREFAGKSPLAYRLDSRARGS